MQIAQPDSVVLAWVHSSKASKCIIIQVIQQAFMLFYSKKYIKSGGQQARQVKKAIDTSEFPPPPPSPPHMFIRVTRERERLPENYILADRIKKSERCQSSLQRRIFSEASWSVLLWWYLRTSSPYWSHYWSEILNRERERERELERVCDVQQRLC